MDFCSTAHSNCGVEEASLWGWWDPVPGKSAMLGRWSLWDLVLGCPQVLLGRMYLKPLSSQCLLSLSLGQEDAQASVGHQSQAWNLEWEWALILSGYLTGSPGKGLHIHPSEDHLRLPPCCPRLQHKQVSWLTWADYLLSALLSPARTLP